jgi:restriction endonuclease S subunit
MTFLLSPQIDNNKIFLVNNHKLEGRLDPSYNLALVKNRISSIYPKHKIGHLTKSLSGGTPSKANLDFWVGTIPWVSPKDMKSFYLSDSIDHITEEAVIESSTNIVPKDTVLLVVRSGILQHTIPISITTREMAINQDIKALIFNSSVQPAYAAYFIDVYQKKLLPLIVKHSTTVQSINTEQFDSLKIPIPPKEIQESIVSKMDLAYSAKKQKEAEAQQLLDSIDDYLLAELGIELPEQEENTVQNRIFTQQLSEISGTRFDPNYNIKIKQILEQKAKYEYIRLGRLIKIAPQYGANEGAVECDSDSDAVRYIRITDINEIGELKYSSWKTAENIEDQYLLNFNDLLFARSGSVGRAYLHKDTNKKAIFAGYLIRFLIDELKADPDYIFYYCHSIIYKFWVEAIHRPAVRILVIVNTSLVHALD